MQFERTLIVAEDDSQVSYLEGCTAPSYDTNQVFSHSHICVGTLHLHGIQGPFKSATCSQACQRQKAEAACSLQRPSA